MASVIRIYFRGFYSLRRLLPGLFDRGSVCVRSIIVENFARQDANGGTTQQIIFVPIRTFFSVDVHDGVWLNLGKMAAGPWGGTATGT